MLLEGQPSFLPVDVYRVPSLDSVCLFQSRQNSVKSASPLPTVTQSRGGLRLASAQGDFPLCAAGSWGRSGSPLQCDGRPLPPRPTFLAKELHTHTPSLPPPGPEHAPFLPLFLQEVCTLLLAAHLLGDQISLLNWLGFALCLSGISLHIALKALHARGTRSPLLEFCLLMTLSPWISPLPIPAGRRQVTLNTPP